MVEEVKKIESSSSSKDSLVLASEAAAKTARELAEEMKAASSSLGSDLQEAQASKQELKWCHVCQIPGVSARFYQSGDNIPERINHPSQGGL